MNTLTYKIELLIINKNKYLKFTRVDSKLIKLMIKINLKVADYNE